LPLKTQGKGCDLGEILKKCELSKPFEKRSKMVDINSNGKRSSPLKQKPAAQAGLNPDPGTSIHVITIDGNE